MPKKIEDVVVPERRRSIRNIPVSKVRREAASPYLPIVRKRNVSFSRRLWFSVIVALIILAVAVLSLFSGATVTYTPRAAELAFANENFSAYKSGEEGLIASAIKLSGDKAKMVEVTGEENVSHKASGIIVIYNTGASSQQLVQNTRFESSDGKIFRISQSILVPAKGSLEAEVKADVAGAEYNIGLSDFTLPGLKGTAKFGSVYGRSKTAMTGGFVGKEKVISAGELVRVKAELEMSLKAELLAKASAEVPANFILMPALSSITFEELPQTDAPADGAVTYNLRGNLVSIMFKKAELSRTLARGKAELADADPVEIKSFDNLEISFGGTPPADLLSAGKINFKVNGGAMLVWKTDEAAFGSALAGKKKSDLLAVLKDFPAVETANANIRPFWKRSFPDEVGSIVIKKDDR